jgi:hypothetical protein
MRTIQTIDDRAIPNGTLQHFGLELDAQGNELSRTPITPAEFDQWQTQPPSWPPVRTALLQDADYNAAVDGATNQRAVTRLEQYAMGNPDNWAMLATLWNSAIASIPAPNPLTPQVCDRFNTLFQDNYLPVTLNRDTALMDAP